MEDSYTGLLNIARQLKDSKKGGGDEEKKGGGDGPSILAPTPGKCMICTEQQADGYHAPCCGNFVCSECMASNNYSLDMFFRPSKGGGGTDCVLCNNPLTSTVALSRWVPQGSLPVLGGDGANVNNNNTTTTTTGQVGTAADAWNFTIYHHCGQPYSVYGWSECDVLSGNCTRCRERSISLTGSTKEHSYELRDLVAALSGFHQRSSARVFAGLSRHYPLAWRALHLTELVQAMAEGVNPDLSLWTEEAIAFLKLKAKEISKELG